MRKRAIILSTIFYSMEMNISDLVRIVAVLTISQKSLSSANHGEHSLISSICEGDSMPFSKNESIEGHLLPDVRYYMRGLTQL